MTRTAELMTDADRMLFKQVCLHNHCSHHLLPDIFTLMLSYDIEAISINSLFTVPYLIKIIPYTYTLYDFV